MRKQTKGVLWICMFDVFILLKSPCKWDMIPYSTFSNLQHAPWKKVPLSKQLGKCICMLSIGELITKRTGFYGNESEEAGNVCLTCSYNSKCDLGPVPLEPCEDVRARCWGQTQLDILRDRVPRQASAALLLSLYMGQTWGQSSVTRTGLRHLAVWTWTPDFWRIAGNSSCLVSGDLRIDFGNLCLTAIPAAGRRRCFWTYRGSGCCPCRKSWSHCLCELISKYCR